MRHMRIIATLMSTAISGMNVPALAQQPPMPATEQPAGGAEKMEPPPHGMGMETGRCLDFFRDPGLEGHRMALENGLPFPPPPPEMGAGFPPRPDHALELASRLSALETVIGIRVAQLDAWRDYTAALTDFLDFPDHTPPGPAAEAEMKPSDIPAANASELFGEEIADHMLERADKARVLKDKAAALRTVLTAYQLQKLEDAERTLDPRPGRFR